ncbi:hypothetical protein [Plantactinospora endophytica]|uniref:Uncharacterized protein n=1 Tax=Plantactinospora endophytica TaxID=673535 RepID=A0ABQ4E0H3_9ACTN|nr:hypothetical protein [Plantactinospora endophytica]GIG87796.1 hypothetical protein Pen02_27320 [Plantactinospora endophytica]
MEAMRTLKRQLSDVVYGRLIDDRNDGRWQAREGSRGRLCNPA